MGRGRLRRTVPPSRNQSPATDRQRHAPFECAQEIAERPLPLAADDEVDAQVGVGPGLRRQARVVATDRDAHARRDGTHQRDDPSRGAALERHDRQADDVGLEVAHQPFDRAANGCLHQHQVGDRDLVMGVHVAGQRREGAVRHADGERRRVLERVGHREQQDAHSCDATPGRCASQSDQASAPSVTMR